VKIKGKITALVILSAALVLLISGFYHSQADSSTKDQLLAQLIRTGLQRWHYSDKKIDDTFSEKVFKEFLEYMDYSKRFFLKSDIDELRKYKNFIDRQFGAGSMLFIAKATQRLDQRIQQVMDFYGDLLAAPFDFSKQESLEMDPEKKAYCSSLEELKTYWRKTLKYRALLRYINLLEEKGKKKNQKELEEESRQGVLKSLKSTFNRLLQANKSDSFSRYLNAFVKVFDPHSTYFQPVDKESYDMEMAGSFEGIGALLGNEDEYVKVVRIIPGGPSWRGKKLEAEDLILKVAQGDEEPVDIIGMRTKDAVKLIRGKKGTLVRLTVKKPDDRIVEIPIIRDVVILEETFAKSVILVHKEANKRFGYIYLPAFYDDFNPGGRNSTDDVKKELEKLKLKQVDGIILDLRDNGGGALRDGVNMSGLFIPKGPIVQVKDKKNHIKILTDPDPGITYTGPLLVMISQLSASSSEILAGALQDYHRALIVGSAHSYGKGTVQAMLNLDQFVSEKREKYDSYGALTITIQKFYRITGKSIQWKGVTPDIVLPNRYDSLEIGERYLDYSLKWDTITAANYKKWKPNSPTSPTLVEKSKTRIQKNPGFKQIKEYAKRIKQMRDQTRYSLQLDEVLKRQDLLKKEREKLENTQIQLAHIQLLPSTKHEKTGPERMKEIILKEQQEWFKELKKDIALGEAVEILNDMIRMEKPENSRQ
jgi:carboxyl-terminal processing protease